MTRLNVKDDTSKFIMGSLIDVGSDLWERCWILIVTFSTNYFFFSK